MCFVTTKGKFSCERGHNAVESGRFFDVEHLKQFLLPDDLPLLLQMNIVLEARLNELSSQRKELGKFILQSVIEGEKLLPLLVGLLV